MVGDLDERTLRTVEAARSAGADWALLISTELVGYASGYDVPVGFGSSPHAGGPSAAIVTADGDVTLVVEDLEEEVARSSRASRVVVVPGFAPLPHPRPLREEYALAITKIVRELGLGGVVAIESGSLPEALAQSLRSSGITLVDATDQLARVRATKTPEEIGCLRRCAELTAVGQRAILEFAQSGMTELELFAEVRKRMESATGCPLSIGVDLLTGIARTAGVMGSPTRRVLEQGDPVLCDLTPRLGGYWGDSCNTFVLDGVPTQAFAEMRMVVWRALEQAAEAIKPGITAGQVDKVVRGVLDADGYTDPLHIGHGIGIANSEYPRIVPGATSILESGMVLMIEPGAYVPEVGGVRLEWMFLVTATGNEVMSPYEHISTTLEAIA